MVLQLTKLLIGTLFNIQAALPFLKKHHIFVFLKITLENVHGAVTFSTFTFGYYNHKVFDFLAKILYKYQ